MTLNFTLKIVQTEVDDRVCSKIGIANNIFGVTFKTV